VWESHVTWGTPVQSFVFLGLLVFELEPMYATSDGQTDGRRTPITALCPLGGGIIMECGLYSRQTAGYTTAAVPARKPCIARNRDKKIHVWVSRCAINLVVLF